MSQHNENARVMRDGSSSAPADQVDGKKSLGAGVRDLHEVGHTAHVPVHYKSSTGRLVVTAAVLVLVGLAVSFILVNRRRAAEEQSLIADTAAAAKAPMAVDVVRVTYAVPTHLLTLPAEVHGWYESTIYARVSGYLKKWNVDIGDHVREGQVLAAIETPELDQQLSAAKAKVEADRAQVKLAEANVHFCEVTLDRFKDAPKGVVSDLERDEKSADYQTSIARLNAAQANLNSSQAEVDRLGAMLAFKQVTAPFDGVITERRADIGDLVTAGSTSSTTSLFRIAQSDQLRVFVQVPQAAVPDIHDGGPATVVAREFPGRLFTGTVSRNAQSLNSEARTLRVEVDLPNKDYALLPGMYVDLSFQTSDSRRDLQVPASAVSFRSGGPQVAIVSADGHVTFREVKIGRDLGTVVEIASGLNADERVALNISNQISNGDIVKATEMDPSGTPAAAKVAAAAASPAGEAR